MATCDHILDSTGVAGTRAITVFSCPAFCTGHLQHASPFVYGPSANSAQLTLCKARRELGELAPDVLGYRLFDRRLDDAFERRFMRCSVSVVRGCFLTYSRETNRPLTAFLPKVISVAIASAPFCGSSNYAKSRRAMPSNHLGTRIFKHFTSGLLPAAGGHEWPGTLRNGPRLRITLSSRFSNNRSIVESVSLQRRRSV